jgi:hypothetical protein
MLLKIIIKQSLFIHIFIVVGAQVNKIIESNPLASNFFLFI